MFAYTWEYRVYTDRVNDFKEVYGPQGDWVKLFVKAKGYLRTDLFEDIDVSGRFISTDYWESRQAWENMKLGSSGEYERIDQACESLTETEYFLGFFEVC